MAMPSEAKYRQHRPFHRKHLPEPGL